VNPPAGVTVRTSIALEPLLIVTVAGSDDRLTLGGTALIVTVCAGVVAGAKLLSPL
jgi:hypothetical protein